MSSKAYEKISNYQALIDLYGVWPLFEDAELIELSFVRGNTLEVMKSEEWDALAPASCFATFLLSDTRFTRGTIERKEAIVQLKLEDLMNVKIEGFNYQNPMLHLIVSEEYAENRKQDIIIFKWGDAALSCNAEIKCINAEVLSVIQSPLHHR